MLVLVLLGGGIVFDYFWNLIKQKVMLVFFNRLYLLLFLTLVIHIKVLFSVVINRSAVGIISNESENCERTEGMKLKDYYRKENRI